MHISSESCDSVIKMSFVLALSFFILCFSNRIAEL